MIAIHRWLRILRLHKYLFFFANLTYNDIISINHTNISYFEKMVGILDMTIGARNKILREIEELRNRRSRLKQIIQVGTCFINCKYSDNVNACFNHACSINREIILTLWIWKMQQESWKEWWEVQSPSMWKKNWLLLPLILWREVCFNFIQWNGKHTVVSVFLIGASRFQYPLEFINWSAQARR